MKDVIFKSPSRASKRLRLLLYGQSGAGKTLSALILAKGIGGRVAVYDTECGRAALKLDNPLIKGLDWDVVEHDYYQGEPSIEDYLAVIRAAEENGYNVLILDSISPEWDYITSLQASMSGNSFANWGRAKTVHRKFLDAVLRSKCHIIATCRSKTEYAVEEGGRKVRRLGLAPQQDSNLPFNYDFVLQVSDGGIVVSVDKDEADLFREGAKINVAQGQQLAQWLGLDQKSETVSNNKKTESSKKETKPVETPAEQPQEVSPSSPEESVLSKYILRIRQLEQQLKELNVDIVPVEDAILEMMSKEELTAYGKQLSQQVQSLTANLENATS